jgi:predicted permease
LFTAGFQLPVSVGGQFVNSRMLYVGPGFFSTMGISITMGREIDERDQPGSLPVAVVSEFFSKSYFGGQNPLGKRIAIGVGNSSVKQVEIVGVAKDVRYGGLRVELPRVVYASVNQAPFSSVSRMTFELRTAGDPLAYVNTARRIVRDVNPLVPVANISSQAAQIEQTISQEIMFARVCTAFAVLALLIACVGLYGTVAYNVARRTNEIGIRVALGAQRTRVIRMILQKVMIAVVVALAIGLPFALKASSYVEAFLYSMKPNDPITIAAAVLILVTAALVAAFIPAHRASRIDPLIALRQE